MELVCQSEQNEMNGFLQAEETEQYERNILYGKKRQQ